MNEYLNCELATDLAKSNSRFCYLYDAYDRTIANYKIKLINRYANYEIELINKDATKIPIILLAKRHTYNVKTMKYLCRIRLFAYRNCLCRIII